MIVDTSILVAILLREDGFEDLVMQIAEEDVCNLSAASYLEASIVLLNRRGSGVELELDRLIAELGLRIIPFTATQARIGRQAHLNFGKGHHPARLNLGDCFSYALARQTGEPLLFIGDDFNQTDLLLA